MDGSSCAKYCARMTHDLYRLFVSSPRSCVSEPANGFSTEQCSTSGSVVEAFFLQSQLPNGQLGVPRIQLTLDCSRLLRLVHRQNSVQEDCILVIFKVDAQESKTVCQSISFSVSPRTPSHAEGPTVQVLMPDSTMLRSHRRLNFTSVLKNSSIVRSSALRSASAFHGDVHVMQPASCSRLTRSSLHIAIGTISASAFPQQPKILLEGLLR